MKPAKRAGMAQIETPHQRRAPLKRLVEGEQLHTVCRDAHCPNIGCWGAGTATFMILGDQHPRLPFCQSRRNPGLRPGRAAPGGGGVEKLRLRYVVVLGDRDGLQATALIFAETIGASAQSRADPDQIARRFSGPWTRSSGGCGGPGRVRAQRGTVAPYPLARPGAGYRRSLELLRRAKAVGTGMMTKSSLMLGLRKPTRRSAPCSATCGAAVDFLTLGRT